MGGIKSTPRESPNRLDGTGPQGTETASLSEGLVRGVGVAPALDRLLVRAGATAAGADLVAVGLGPGSYTGVRVGVSFAKTLAFAAGRPVKGVCSFDAMALAAPPGPSPLAVGLPTVLQVGRQSGLTLPRVIHVVAIEVDDMDTLGAGLTPAVEAALPRAEALVRALAARSAA